MTLFYSFRNSLLQTLKPISGLAQLFFDNILKFIFTRIYENGEGFLSRFIELKSKIIEKGLLTKNFVYFKKIFANSVV